MVELRKKITLKTKVAKTVTTNATLEVPNKKASNRGKTIGIAIFLIIVAVVIFFFLKIERDNNIQNITLNETVAQQDEVSPG